jgi:hypothetical protein
MERDPYGDAGDVGRDHARDRGDEPAPAWRDAAPDVLAPIDATAPVSGHVPAQERSASPADSPEHDWSAASPLIFPVLRPPGTQGQRIDRIDAATMEAMSVKSHNQPLIDEGPCDLVVVYALPAGGFDVIVSGDHLLSWGVQPSDVQDAALANLQAWSASAPWTDEVSGDRRLMSSDTGDGWDAVRVILPETVDRLTRELGATGRILVGLPERHVLVAGTLRPDDAEFAGLFTEFIVEQSGGADEPIDRRVFELKDGRLVEFTP